jgi:hypothetical protein
MDEDILSSISSSSSTINEFSSEETTRLLIDALQKLHFAPNNEVNCQLPSVSSETFAHIQRILETIFTVDADGERFVWQYLQFLHTAVNNQQEIFRQAQEFVNTYMDLLKYASWSVFF